MELTLFREGSIEGIGTLGYLICGGSQFASVEREWFDNEQFVSCIPTGRYRLVKYSSEKYPDHYALVNEELGVYLHKEDIPRGVKGRYAILIHIANTAAELQGCIAIGMKRGYVTPKNRKLGLGVSSSGTAFKIMMNRLKNDEENFITINAIDHNW